MNSAEAIIVLPEEKVAGIRPVPMPQIRDEWIIVKTKAVALNPTDWKHIDFGYSNAGAKIGCDYAGVVEEVGSKVVDFKKGDRVAGFCHGGHRLDHETGTFGEYILAKACGSFKIPDSLSFEQAATVPVSTITCGMGLYMSLKLPLPGQLIEESFPVLIHGGSSSSGVRGIQFAKLSGLTVIATASPHNFDYLKSLGADFVFDYHSPTCGADIRRLTQNKLRYAWDCVGGGEEICGEALSSVEPGKYGYIASVRADVLKETNPLVEEPLYVLAYHALHEPFEFQNVMVHPPVEEMEFALMFKELTRDLLEKGALKDVEIVLNKGGSGLSGVMEGLDTLRNGKVSGKKLVYTL